MPLYDYKCPDCGDVEEKLMSYDDMKATDGKVPCSKCGKTNCARTLENLTTQAVRIDPGGIFGKPFWRGRKKWH